MSELQKTIKTLRDFNAWRRADEDMEQPDPRQVGLAIDAAIEAMEQLSGWKAAHNIQMQLVSSAKIQRDKAEEKAERYRLEILQLETQLLALKNRLEEFSDAIDFTLDNFSCRTFTPQKFL